MLTDTPFRYVEVTTAMDIAIRIEGRHDLTGQIFRQLRTAIVDGRLEGGARLPSTRDLAKQLGVSRKTTLDAFERLVAEGYLTARGRRHVRRRRPRARAACGRGGRVAGRRHAAARRRQRTSAVG